MRLIAGLLIILTHVVALKAAAAAAPVPRFVDRAPDLGIAHVYSGGWEHFVGGGVAAFDCNDDARPDLFVAGGAGEARLLINRTDRPGAPIAMADETPDVLRLRGVTGAYPMDVDNDGRLDLVVLRVGVNHVLRGGPGCRFEEMGDALGLTDADRWTTAFSATWEPGNARPTLAFGNYIDRDDPNGPFEACDSNEIRRPRGRADLPASAPAPAYAPPILIPGHCALSMLFSDWNRAGRQDLRVSNDRQYYIRDGQEDLWRLDPVPRRYTEAEGWARLSIWGMGIASRDLTGDGLPEVYLTSMADQLLLIRDPARAGPVWREAPYSRGATAQRPYVGDDGRPSTGWHAEFGDVDNDGLDDLFVAKGNVDQMGENAIADPDDLLMKAPDGSFSEAGLKAGLASTARGRGAALVDLNFDGLLDVVVVNRRAPMEINENLGPAPGHWLGLDARQAAPNTRLVGSFIELRAGGRRAVREITVGGGHASGQAGFEHFGLGAADQAKVRIVTPDGTASDWTPVQIDRYLRLTRTAGKTALDVAPVAFGSVER